MSTNDTFLAIFLGSKTSPRMVAWNSLSEEVRRTKMQEGIAAWKAWADKHHESQIERCKHQYNADVHHQPFPESVLKEQ